MAEQKMTSIVIGRAALRIAATENRTEEQRVKELLAASGIRSTAVDFGGEFMASIVKIVERAVVAAQRQGIVTETHVGAGAVALTWAAKLALPAAASICALPFTWRWAC